MERFEFDNRKKVGRANDNLKNGPTTHGALEIYPDFGPKDDRDAQISLDIRGPAGAFRGSAVIDKATARKVGAALLKWSGFNVDVDLLVKQIEWLAWQHICDEQKALLNLLGALCDLMKTKGD